MATSIFRNKNLVRPIKRGKARRQREDFQRKRLISLGMSEEAVRKLNVKEVRDLMKRPMKVQKACAAKS